MRLSNLEKFEAQNQSQIRITGWMIASSWGSGNEEKFNAEDRRW